MEADSHCNGGRYWDAQHERGRHDTKSLSRSFSKLAGLPSNSGLGVYNFDNGLLVSSRSTRTTASSSSSESGSSSDGSSNLRARTMIYFAFCLGVQMFMSYDAGATSSSLDTLQTLGLDLSETEIGILGSIDKFGQILLSMVWGRALQVFPTKLLLVSALITNAGFSLMFGVVLDKHWMLFAKFMQGSTEALQGVWGTVWTLANAPEEQKTQWMGLGAIAAGLGNGVGTAISGFGTANGLPYSFAFIFQACVLAAFWLAMLLCTPGDLLEARPEEDADGDEVDDDDDLLKPVVSHRKSTDLGTHEQLVELWRNKLYVRTVFCVALVNFFISGCQYIWTRTFVMGPWRINKNYVVVSFLVVTGAGSGLGVSLGPYFVDRSGGYSTEVGKYRTLSLMLRFILVAAAFAAISVITISNKHVYYSGENSFRMVSLCSDSSATYFCSDSELADPLLWLLWLSHFITFMMLSATIATFAAINCESVQKSMQSFATGTTVCAQNLLGYAAGSLMPGVVMDVVFHLNLRVQGYKLSMPAQLGIGIAFVNASILPLLMSVFLARRASKANIRA